jgi:hypothetical protein
MSAPPPSFTSLHNAVSISSVLKVVVISHIVQAWPHRTEGGSACIHADWHPLDIDYCLDETSCNNLSCRLQLPSSSDASIGPVHVPQTMCKAQQQAAKQLRVLCGIRSMYDIHVWHGF